MFLHVTDVAYFGEYRLRLTFNNGDVKEVDLKDELWGQAFQPLKDSTFFRQVRINETGTTIEWPNGADLAPEFLYKIGVDVTEREAEKTPA